VVEDDPVAADDLRALLESRGDSVRLAATVEEALAALAEETFCYVVLDQQLPTRAGEPPLVGGGERVLRAARLKDDRRVGAFHTTPIVILTSYSGHEDFVSKMYDLGASAFMSKPLRGNFERMLDKVRVVLERAKRGEHAACAGLAIETEPVEQAPEGGLAARLGAKTFGEIGIRVVDGHTVRVSHQKKAVRATYIDLGLATKTRNPIREWELLLDLCAGHGSFRWKKYGTYNNARQRVFVLSAKLKAAFGLEDSPFHRFDNTHGWRSRFFASSEVGGDEE
jgi:CheY-like chemotaxis protein